jgi:type III pantothenate kinase
MPRTALGTNTVQAIQAGILLGYEGLVKFMVDRIRLELNDPDLSTVATGGLSSIITPGTQTFNHIEPNLTLDGLRIVAGCI